jgi:hypothetical protein
MDNVLFRPLFGFSFLLFAHMQLYVMPTLFYNFLARFWCVILTCFRICLIIPLVHLPVSAIGWKKMMLLPASALVLLWLNVGLTVRHHGSFFQVYLPNFSRKWVAESL